MVRIDLKGTILQIAARLERLSCTLLVRDGCGVFFADELALQAVQEFLFRSGTFQVRLREQDDRFVRCDLRRRLTQLFDARGHASAHERPERKWNAGT